MRAQSKQNVCGANTLTSTPLGGQSLCPQCPSRVPVTVCKRERDGAQQSQIVTVSSHREKSFPPCLHCSPQQCRSLWNSLILRNLPDSILKAGAIIVLYC